MQAKNQILKILELGHMAMKLKYYVYKSFYNETLKSNLTVANSSDIARFFQIAWTFHVTLDFQRALQDAF